MTEDVVTNTCELLTYRAEKPDDQTKFFSLRHIISIVGLFCPNNQKLIYRRTVDLFHTQAIFYSNCGITLFLASCSYNIWFGSAVFKQSVNVQDSRTDSIPEKSRCLQQFSSLEPGFGRTLGCSNLFPISIKWSHFCLYSECFVECPKPLKLKLTTFIFLTKEKTKRWSLKEEKNICTLCFYHLTPGCKWFFAWLLSFEFLWDHEITADSSGIL